MPLLRSRLRGAAGNGKSVLPKAIARHTKCLAHREGAAAAVELAACTNAMAFNIGVGTVTAGDADDVELRAIGESDGRCERDD